MMGKAQIDSRTAIPRAVFSMRSKKGSHASGAN